MFLRITKGRVSEWVRLRETPRLDKQMYRRHQLSGPRRWAGAV
jgi:hypothetical protein